MLRDSMLRIISEVNSELAEREELVQLIAVSLLTRTNLFILGDTGQAKSYAINLFRERITGAKQFERLLSKQCDEEQLFGRIDLSSIIPGNVAQEVLDHDLLYQKVFTQIKDSYSCEKTGSPADEKSNAVTPNKLESLTATAETLRKALSIIHGNEPMIKVSGKIPDSHIIFLDELFKANDGILNALLTALNERKYTNEGKTVQIPAISFMAASNEIPNFNDPAEKILRPLYDRFQLKIVTHYIEDRDSRLKMLKSKQNRTKSSAPTATLTLDELYQMQEEVRQIIIPESANELMDDILCALREKGVHISDRKFLNYAPFCQAMAWLDGRDAVDSADLMVLKYYLWTEPKDAEIIDPILTELCSNPFQGKINEILGMAKETYDEFESAIQLKKDSRPLIKFRNDFMLLYGMYTDLQAKTGPGQKQMEDLLTRLEEFNKRASDSMGFSYVPLEQQSQLK